jgi:hypothetical protein
MLGRCQSPERFSSRGFASALDCSFGIGVCSSRLCGNYGCGAAWCAGARRVELRGPAGFPWERVTHGFDLVFDADRIEDRGVGGFCRNRFARPAAARRGTVLWTDRRFDDPGFRNGARRGEPASRRASEG